MNFLLYEIRNHLLLTLVVLEVISLIVSSVLGFILFLFLKTIKSIERHDGYNPQRPAIRCPHAGD